MKGDSGAADLMTMNEACVDRMSKSGKRTDRLSCLPLFREIPQNSEPSADILPFLFKGAIAHMVVLISLTVQ